MKLPPLSKSSSLGSGPDLGLGHKGETIASRPMHQLERHIAPKILGGQIHTGAPSAHGSHMKSLSSKSPMSGSTPAIPSGY